MNVRHRRWSTSRIPGVGRGGQRAIEGRVRSQVDAGRPVGHPRADGLVAVRFPTARPRPCSRAGEGKSPSRHKDKVRTPRVRPRPDQPKYRPRSAAAHKGLHWQRGRPPATVLDGTMGPAHRPGHPGLQDRSGAGLRFHRRTSTRDDTTHHQPRSSGRERQSHDRVQRHDRVAADRGPLRIARRPAFGQAVDRRPGRGTDRAYHMGTRPSAWGTTTIRGPMVGVKVGSTSRKTSSRGTSTRTRALFVVSTNTAKLTSRRRAAGQLDDRTGSSTSTACHWGKHRTSSSVHLARPPDRSSPGGCPRPSRPCGITSRPTFVRIGTPATPSAAPQDAGVRPTDTEYVQAIWNPVRGVLHWAPPSRTKYPPQQTLNHHRHAATCVEPTASCTCSARAAGGGHQRPEAQQTSLQSGR